MSYRVILTLLGKTCLLSVTISEYHHIYCIRPNYRTVCLGFSKLLEKPVVKYQPNKGML